MAKNRSEKSRYLSRYAPSGYVTAAQYISELMCERKAKGDLPIRFWKIPEWIKYYKSQITACNKLLSKYDEQHILAALKTKQGKRIYSLRVNWLPELIEKEQSKPKSPVTIKSIEISFR